MYAQHHRFAVYNFNQHPYKHSLTEFPYSNPAMPSGTVYNAQQALDWVLAVLYPNHQAAVATVADLPAVGNTVNDYRVVQDDGDGKAAGYRWEAREGQASATWHKILDMDWGTDSVLQAWQSRNQDLFVMRGGYDDLDGSGVALAGALAGQHVYGGKTAGSHLTLHANSGDGVGAQTGYVQFDDDSRPTADGTYSLGTTAARWLKVWTGEVTAGTLTIGAASIVDSSGAISLGATSLTTSTFVKAGTLTIADGSISDTSGAISFSDENLLTTGTLGAGVATFTSVTAMGAASAFATATTIANLTFENNQITAVDDWIDFLDTVIYLEGALNSTAEITTSSFGIFGNLKISGDTVSQNGFSGNLYLTAGGGGSDKVVLGAQAEVLGDFIVDGDTYVGTDFKISGMTLSWPTGAGANVATFWGRYLDLNVLSVYSHTDNSTKLGDTANRFSTLYLGTGISDGTNAITMATLLSFRSALVGAGVGMTLFYDGSVWSASLPDTEVDHGSISGLADDDHAQYALLAGRAGGQTLKGGTLASQNLTLQSTAHATQGSILCASDLSPSAANTRDLGAVAATWKDIFMAGQFYGLRLPNYTTAGRPAASAGNKGRLVWDTDLTAVYADVGGTWAKVGAEKAYKADATGWTGLVSTVTYTVDGSDGTVTGKVVDSRLANWELKDNSNNYAQIGCVIDFPTSTTVRVTVGEPLPAGTYTILGVG